MKKKIFAFDFIRAFATIIIVLTHYNTLFVYNVNRPDLFVGSLTVFKTFIGSYGVSLFLILSGAVLMYKYSDKKLDIKEFYINRIKKIFPLFWFAFFLVLSINVFQHGNIYLEYYRVPKINLIYSFLGIDSYLARLGVNTFSIIGEWFLGFIIIFYIIFPFLLFVVKKYPKITAVCGIIIYIITLILLYNDNQYAPVILPTRIIELLFGMYFVRYKIKVKPFLAIVCWLFLLSVLVFNFNLESNLLVTLVGISSFLVLYYISIFLDKINIVNNLVRFISNISYACFIIHHWLIFEMVSKVDLNNLTIYTSYLLFICILFMVLLGSYILKKTYDSIQSVIIK